MQAESHVILNDEQQGAVRAILEARSPFFFLTGSAGTGKSTVILELKKRFAAMKKNYLVVAPTAIAAINVEGKTIHSQFAISSRGLAHFNKKTYTDNNELRELIHTLDYLIIDEISMVRADLMDAILQILKLYGPCPFESNGGVKIVFVGDLLQLPPILRDPLKEKNNSEEYKAVKKEYDEYNKKYETKYFLSAHGLPVPQIQLLILKENHRIDKSAPQQNDFYKHLNIIRLGRENIHQTAQCGDSYFDLVTQNPEIELHNACSYFNTRYKKDSHKECDITITAVKKHAGNINNARLKELLPQLPIKIKARIKNYIKERSQEETESICKIYYLSPVKLEIKPNARVMVTKNMYVNNLYIPNGALATITSITEKPNQENLNPEDRDYDIELKMIRPHQGEKITTSRSTWRENITVSKGNGQTEEIASYEFNQIPLMLAWAITIHKSQGLTLENYAIFPYGNKTESLVYVALSRAKRITDIHLEAKLTPDKIICNEKSRKFYINQD